MRIVSGTYKGRSLKAVPGNSTRPTTDKVKEAIFNMVGPYFDGGLVLDLFAGSGGLGIEALSRGMERAIFVDRDGKAIATIQENIKSCGLEERVEVYRNDAERALKAMTKRELQSEMIFLDPPYKQQQIMKLIDYISGGDILSRDGIIVCEHSSDIVLPDEINHLHVKKKEKYGIIGVTIYKSNDTR